MKIVFGCDHGGLNLKQQLKERLEREGYEIHDLGISTWEEIDYPDKAVEVAHYILDKKADCGILVCGTGIGMSIAANKVNGIRAAVCSDTFSARMAKEHNNANIITLGERTIGSELAYEIVKAYLNTEFIGDKHFVRVNKIMAIDNK